MTLPGGIDDNFHKDDYFMTIVYGPEKLLMGLVRVAAFYELKGLFGPSKYEYTYRFCKQDVELYLFYLFKFFVCEEMKSICKRD